MNQQHQGEIPNKLDTLCLLEQKPRKEGPLSTHLPQAIHWNDWPMSGNWSPNPHIPSTVRRPKNDINTSLCPLLHHNRGIIVTNCMRRGQHMGQKNELGLNT